MTSQNVQVLLERVAHLRSFNLGRGAERVPADEVLEVLCTRRLDHVAFPIVEIEASYVKSRREGRAVFEAIVAVGGRDAEGDYEALGFDVGDSEDPAFWVRILLTLKARGLAGVETVVSDDHGGLVEALSYTYPDATWAPRGNRVGRPASQDLDDADG